MGVNSSISSNIPSANTSPNKHCLEGVHVHHIEFPVTSTDYDASQYKMIKLCYIIVKVLSIHNKL